MNAGDIPQPPAVLADGFNREGLQFVRFKLRNRTITVTEPTYESGFLRGKYIGEAMSEDFGDPMIQALVTNILCPLRACSTGDMPTLDEMRKMAEADIEFWIAQARKVAPKWFAWLDEVEKQIGELSEQEQKAQIKKKGRKRRASRKS